MRYVVSLGGSVINKGSPNSTRAPNEEVAHASVHFDGAWAHCLQQGLFPIG